MYSDNIFKGFEDWAVWLDESDHKFNIKQEFNFQEKGVIMIIQTENFQNTDNSIYEFQTHQNNEHDYMNYVINLTEKSWMNYTCGEQSKLKIDSFYSMRFRIIERYLIKKINENPTTKNKMVVLKGDHELLQHTEQLETLIKNLTDKLENTNFIILLTNGKFDIKLSEINQKNKLRFIKLQQRTFDPTVKLFTEILEKHLQETYTWENKVLTENSIRNFITKLGTNFNYFSAFLNDNKNITLNKFVKNKLKEKKGIFQYLNNDLTTFIYLSKIAEAISKQDSNNSWIDLNEINGIYKEAYSHTPSKSQESLIKHDILVLKGMSVRFATNELYHAYLHWVKHKKKI